MEESERRKQAILKGSFNQCDEQQSSEAKIQSETYKSKNKPTADHSSFNGQTSIHFDEKEEFERNMSIQALSRNLNS